MTSPSGQVTTLVNPARAGMILDEYYALRNYLRKPRASGDDPYMLTQVFNDRA